LNRYASVDGGVGPPILAVMSGEHELLRVEFPELAVPDQKFEKITDEQKNISGRIISHPKGFRFFVKIVVHFMTRAEWRSVVSALNYYRDGYTLRFYPHDDDMTVYYDVLPIAGIATPYFEGKYLGYSTVVELIGRDILRYIPRSTAMDYFCSVSESGYSSSEVSQYSDSEQATYSENEIAQFTSTQRVKKVI